VRGAFSGASNDRAGRFEVADGGTIFLDEIGELPLIIQAKLLRTLQNGEIQRLGEDRTRRVNVRVIVATNRDLQQGVKDGVFRLTYTTVFQFIPFISRRCENAEMTHFCWLGAF
jgi:anaerobic nitric oxide reductase transcription regulator